MRLALTEREDPMTAGFVGSILFHILILLAIMFGVPSFFEPEVLEEPPTIEFATLADITAAPKVQKVSNKKPEKPKEQPAPEKPKPKVETPPPAPAAPPPPPAPEPQAAVIPDKTQKPEEKKPEEKPKKKEKKQDEDFNKLLANITKDQPAPETDQKPKPKPAAAVEPTSGPQASLVSDVPLTASESDGIANQIRPNWNVDVGSLPDPREYVAFLRVTFAPDGTVQTVDYLDKGRLSDPRYRSVAESCKRAFFITKQIRFPPGKVQGSIRFGCDPSAL